jgi:hypothetical protein
MGMSTEIRARHSWNLEVMPPKFTTPSVRIRTWRLRGPLVTTVGT